MMEKNPWVINGEKTVYDNPWISVTEYDVLNPAGNKGIYGKVHFKNTAVAVIVLDDEQNTWLVGQYRFTLNRYSWEIPEGGAPYGTSPLEGAKRELMEETGLHASNWRLLFNMHLSNSVSDEIAFIYLATGLTQHAAEPEETEDLAVQKIPFNRALSMVENGTITDSMSVAAILKVQLMMITGEL
ncbi:NUDIX hydrolase [Sediminibacterium roseum]|uniref:GDP-mannose pyrophosphatase n=1 Tax=Sediminibacterium roseum TaxID=1978412 RepID=A0ABW9ZUE4_9BACT|nr:NUDIX hydrolase [Sediminibacterium roseum]NCI50761.1 NUDIX hydrolase [Sediminibacterium roseum]